MRIQSSRAGRVATTLAAPVAIVTAAALIWSASNAAFSSSTRNSGNNWSTGTVALSDDDAGSTRFLVTNMLPGQTETRCITVTSNASVPGLVRGYVVNPIGLESDLADHLQFTSRSGTGGSFASCTAGPTPFVPEREDIPASAPLPFSTLLAHNSYATAVLAVDWVVPAGRSMRTYEITWTFDTTGVSQSELNGMQGVQVGLDFQWELQNS